MAETETTAPAIGFITSNDAKSWSKTTKLSGASDYGVSMATYRGELYGIVLATDKTLRATKYKAGDTGNPAWKSYRTLPAKFKAVGRVNVAAYQDRFYVIYRGTNDRIYLIWTNDFTTWRDVGEFSKGGLTKQSPAIVGYNGKLFAVCTGYGKDIHYAERGARTHEVLRNWHSINDRTENALELAVHHSALFLFYTRQDRKAICCRTHVANKVGWGKIRQFAANITSGPSAVSFKTDQLLLSWVGTKGVIFRAIVNSHIAKVSRAGIKGKRGATSAYAGTYMGKAFISYAVGAGNNDYEDSSEIEDEKTEFFHVEEVGDDLDDEVYSEVYDEQDDWDCKWNENTTVSKSWFRKMLCL